MGYDRTFIVWIDDEMQIEMRIKEKNKKDHDHLDDNVDHYVTDCFFNYIFYDLSEQT